MSCFICGKCTCAPSLHSEEEQEYFSDASEAHENYLNVLERCMEAYQNRDKVEEKVMDDQREIATAFKSSGMGCNCDLDSWEPERSTGHSCVCRIHKATKGVLRGDRTDPRKVEAA